MGAHHDAPRSVVVVVVVVASSGIARVRTVETTAVRAVVAN